ncbi:MAG: hypothetical protein IH855_09795 [Bacteroidetes bacterium]|nr:hypothetical protein [Bacteroidota bacterium]
MTALLAIEFESEANTSVALHALRNSGAVITSLDVSANDVVATVEVANYEVLNAAVEAVCRCSGVRSGVAFPSEA